MAGRSERAIAKFDRILVVKLADMGDAILATSAVGALRRAHPLARIDVLSAGAGAAIFHLCDAVDEVFSLDKRMFDRPTGLINPRAGALLLALTRRLRSRRYDAIVLLHHLTTPFGARKFSWLCRAIGAPLRAGLDNGRGTFLTHRAIDLGFGAKSVHDYGLDVVALLGTVIDGAQPRITISGEAERQIDELLAKNGLVGDFVVIHPSVGSYATARNWYPDRFTAVANSIQQSFSLPTLLVGATDAMEVAERIAQYSLSKNLVGQTTIPQLTALLRRARLVIGADSGIVHLAAALRVSTIAIFGPSNHEAWSPFGSITADEFRQDPTASGTIVVRSGIPCSPCFYTGFSLGRREGCPLRTCLDQISAEYITQIATQLLILFPDQKSTNNQL